MNEILIIEDHPLVTRSLTMLIKENFAPANVHLSDIFSEALDKLDQTTMTMVIMDITVPGGGNASMVKSLRAKQPDIPILVYTGRDEKLNAISYIKAGANGFLSKNSGEEEIVKAIETVLDNKRYFSGELWQLIITNFADNNSLGANPMESLTKRELEITELLIDGKWTKEIAETLDLKETTISTHKLRIFQKMKVSNVIEIFKKIQLYTL